MRFCTQECHAVAQLRRRYLLRLRQRKVPVHPSWPMPECRGIVEQWLLEQRKFHRFTRGLGRDLQGHPSLYRWFLHRPERGPHPRGREG